MKLLRQKPEVKEEEVPTVDEAAEAEKKRKAKLEKEQKIYSEKKAKGIIGTRSLFGQAGGRGFFG